MSAVADVIRSIGWLHSAGGTGPYLSLRARAPRLTRQHIDYSVYRDFEVVEVLAVRESMMLVPREDIAVALAAGRRSTIARFSKLPIDAEDLDKLADRIVKTIGEGARTADQLRSEIPPKLIADLGEVGKKAGFGSTLPVALRLLQSQGRILRIGEDFRLDAKRYSYRKWPASIPIGAEPRDLDAALAERFVRWTAPNVDDFAFFA
ncbi:MAG TPA: crosslink repair DNA glycosylase YcaQ family protein, partial [Thermoanaerobaculia bacterium]|nr:crosslink repair DNA glycosylase YcaQ family protein [Thermoanaerobaculia bacterium]